jgi:hypothetical protein
MDTSQDMQQAIQKAADLMGCSADEIEAMLRDEKKRTVNGEGPMERHLTSAAAAVSAIWGLSDLARHLGGFKDCVDQTTLELSGWRPYTAGAVVSAIEQLAERALDGVIEAGRIVGWDVESNGPLDPPRRHRPGG